MINKELTCRLSLEAETDIENIFDYSESEYGLQKAIEYTSKFNDVFIQLSQTPQLGRARNEIREGLRSLVQREHIIFYRILTDHIRIVRVLHGRSDIPNFFEKS